MAEIHDHSSEHSDDIKAEPGPEQEALKAINYYQNSWNTRNLEGMEDAFHWPHVRISSGRIHYMEKPLWQPDFFEKFIAATGWHYSLWDYRRAIQSTDNKVHFACQFSRYREDDSLIGVYPTLWIVANIDGKWGVQARSSFAP